MNIYERVLTRVLALFYFYFFLKTNEKNFIERNIKLIIRYSPSK